MVLSGVRPLDTLGVVPIDEVERRPRSIAIGNFDGVHLGHRAVLRSCDTVLTFDPHPLRVLRPGAAPRVLTARPQKIAKLAAAGVREVVLIPFDERWAQLSARAFVDDVLVGTLGAAAVSVGFNFRFGARGAGDPTMLRRDGRFAARVVDGVTVDGEVVSSTAVRNLVVAGATARAAALLGTPLVHRATIRADGGVEFAPDLALPAAGTQACEIDGERVQLSFDGHPHLAGRGCRPTACTVDVTFVHG